MVWFVKGGSAPRTALYALVRACGTVAVHLELTVGGGAPTYAASPWGTGCPVVTIAYIAESGFKLKSPRSAYGVPFAKRWSKQGGRGYVGKGFGFGFGVRVWRRNKYTHV